MALFKGKPGCGERVLCYPHGTYLVPKSRMPIKARKQPATNKPQHPRTNTPLPAVTAAGEAFQSHAISATRNLHINVEWRKALPLGVLHQAKNFRRPASQPELHDALQESLLPQRHQGSIGIGPHPLRVTASVCTSYGRCRRSAVLVLRYGGSADRKQIWHA